MTDYSSKTSSIGHNENTPLLSTATVPSSITIKDKRSRFTQFTDMLSLQASATRVVRKWRRARKDESIEDQVVCLPKPKMGIADLPKE
jgi:hypothetical protein